MDDMVWYSGIGGYDRPSLEALYAFGRPGPFRRSLGSAYRYWARPYADYLPRSVFQPWPLVPGDIYGYPYLNMVEQPLGYRLIWTGPNSYIYRPVYQSDLTPAERPPEAAGPSEPEKPQAEPILAPPAIEKPRPEPVPAPAPVPAPRHGPREF